MLVVTDWSFLANAELGRIYGIVLMLVEPIGLPIE